MPPAEALSIRIVSTICLLLLPLVAVMVVEAMRSWVKLLPHPQAASFAESGD